MPAIVHEFDPPPSAPLYLCPSDRAARGWRRHLTERGIAFADCVAVETWLVAVWQRIRLFGMLPDAPALLGAEAQTTLWHRLIGDHASLLASECDRLAGDFDEAWLLAERHGLPRGTPAPTAGADDNVEWFATLRAAAQRWLAGHGALTRAELPRRLAGCVAQWRALAPGAIRLTPAFASDPALALLWQRLADAGVEVAPADGTPVAVATDLHLERTRDPEHDQEAALQWAATQLATTTGDVTLIVPGLAASRDAWQRALRRHCNPEWWRAPASDLEHFNLSLGQSVAAHPTIAALLTLVRATTQPVAVETLAQALLHPRWGTPLGISAAVHQRLRSHIEQGIAESTLAGWPLPGPVSGAPGPISSMLATAGVPARERRVSRREHRGSIDALATAFAGPAWIARSELFQLDEAWQALLQRWQRLDDWFAPPTWSQAVSELSRLAESTLFQPKSGAGRLHVMGLLESAGVPLATARLVGLDDRVLPERFAPNPFLPRGWQSAQRVGLGARPEVLARSARLMQHWRALVARLTVSCPLSDDDGPVGLSPLLHGLPARPVAVADAAMVAAPAAALALQTLVDERLPVANPADAAGRPLSASRLREQAQCPRRAAALRLGLKPWPELAVGITPLVRGNLVHGMLKAYGEARMADRDPGLAALEQLDALLAREALARPDVAAVAWRTERARINRLLVRVMERDAAREGFAIVAVEAALDATVAGQRFTGLLDRLDDNGQCCVIFDYKTGAVSRSDWLPEKRDGRLADPQLPLYALMHAARRAAQGEAATGSPVRAVAWFRVNDDAVDCIGIGEDDDLVGGNGGNGSNGSNGRNAGGGEAEPWDTLNARWHDSIAVLVDEWQRGVADVAPIQGALTCRHCDYGGFCRERWSLRAEADPADGEAVSAEAGHA